MPCVTVVVWCVPKCMSCPPSLVTCLSLLSRQSEAYWRLLLLLLHIVVCAVCCGVLHAATHDYSSAW
jgi:hypothetical protein